MAAIMRGRDYYDLFKALDADQKQHRLELFEECWLTKNQFEGRTIERFNHIAQIDRYTVNLSYGVGMTKVIISANPETRLYYMSWTRGGLNNWFDITASRKICDTIPEILDDMNQNHPALFEWILWHPI